MWPRPCKQTFVPPSHWGSIWNLALYGPAVLEKIFENGGRTDEQQTDDGACPYYKLTNEPKGSGELKTMFFVPPACRCYMWNMVRISFIASEEMLFVNVNGWMLVVLSFKIVLVYLSLVMNKKLFWSGFALFVIIASIWKILNNRTAILFNESQYFFFSFCAESIVWWGENGRFLRKIIWPPASKPYM